MRVPGRPASWEFVSFNLEYRDDCSSGGIGVLTTGEKGLVERVEQSTDKFNRAFGIVIYHLRRMCEDVAMEAMKVCGAHAYVRNRPPERIYRDLTGSVVMAWKTGLIAQQLGLATLGRPFVIGGPIAVG